MKRLFLIFVLGMPIVANFAGTIGKRSDRKIIEISKIIKLSSMQENAIRKAYDEYNEKVDSALYKVQNAVEASKIKYYASKEFNKVLMSILTEKQRNTYIQITSTREIEAKTQYKIMLLKESNEYSDLELNKMKKEIYSYLMAEKLVYVRDKYDIKKQKENISRLKNVRPQSLRESEIREKQKAQGKIVNGKINW